MRQHVQSCEVLRSPLDLLTPFFSFFQLFLLFRNNSNIEDQIRLTNLQSNLIDEKNKRQGRSNLLIKGGLGLQDRLTHKFQTTPFHQETPLLPNQGGVPRSAEFVSDHSGPVLSSS